MATDNFDKTWIDVGYWVEGDGRVREVELLRSSGSTEWARQLLASIQQRIYAPLADPGGSYRIERFTYTSLWEQRLGTRIRQRSADARIESLDLSADGARHAQGSNVCFGWKAGIGVIASTAGKDGLWVENSEAVGL